MSLPLVSVILPTHNRADVLPIAIRSILRQSLANFELIIVGDGCTDNTAEVVSEFSDSRIQWLDLPKSPNFGYANRNIAFRMACGRYIGFMAHDDIVAPDHLEHLVAAIEESEADLVYTRPLWVSPDGVVNPSFFNLNCPQLLVRFLAMQAQEIAASCVLHRRSCFDRIGYWDEDRASCGDWEFWVRVLKAQDSRGFKYIATPTCLHFLASWRSADQVPPSVYWRQQQAGSVKNKFPLLKLPTATATTQQESVWNLMSQDSQAWFNWLRSEIQILCDSQAREAIEIARTTSL